MQNEPIATTHAEPSKLEPRAPESPPLADIVGRLSTDLLLLVRQEAALAKHEIGERVGQAKSHAIPLVIGAVALLGGGSVLLAAAVLALALILPAWLAAVIVGTVVTTAGALALRSGKQKLAGLSLTPEHTLENVRRDVNAIKRAAT